MLYSADYTTELWTTEDHQFDQLFPEPPKKVKAEQSIRQLGDFQHFLNTKATTQYEFQSANIRIPYQNPLYQDVKVKTIEDRRLERERAKLMSKNTGSNLDISRLLEQVQNSVPSFSPGKATVKQNGAQKMSIRPVKIENVPTNNPIKLVKNVTPESVLSKSFKFENVHETQGTVHEKSKPDKSEKPSKIGKENDERVHEKAKPDKSEKSSKIGKENDKRVQEKAKDCPNFKVQSKQEIVQEKVKPIDRVSPPQFQKRPRKSTPNSSQAPTKPYQEIKSEPSSTPVTKINYEIHKSEITSPSKCANNFEKSSPIDKVRPDQFEKRPSEMNSNNNQAPKKPLQETKSSPSAMPVTINNRVKHDQFQKRQREESSDSLQTLQAPKKPYPKMNTPLKESSIFDIMTDIVLPSKGENLTPIQGLSKKDQNMLPPKDDQHSPTLVPPKSAKSTPIQTVSKNAQITLPTEAARQSPKMLSPKSANYTPILTVSKAGQGMLPSKDASHLPKSASHLPKSANSTSNVTSPIQILPKAGQGMLAPKDASHSPKSANSTSNVFPPIQSFSKSGQSMLPSKDANHSSKMLPTNQSKFKLPINKEPDFFSLPSDNFMQESQKTAEAENDDFYSSLFSDVKSDQTLPVKNKPNLMPAELENNPGLTPIEQKKHQRVAFSSIHKSRLPLSSTSVTNPSRQQQLQMELAQLRRKQSIKKFLTQSNFSQSNRTQKGDNIKSPTDTQSFKSEQKIVTTTSNQQTAQHSKVKFNVIEKSKYEINQLANHPNLVSLNVPKTSDNYKGAKLCTQELLKYQMNHKETNQSSHLRERPQSFNSSTLQVVTNKTANNNSFLMPEIKSNCESKTKYPAKVFSDQNYIDNNHDWARFEIPTKEPTAHLSGQNAKLISIESPIKTPKSEFDFENYSSLFQNQSEVKNISEPNDKSSTDFDMSWLFTSEQNIAQPSIKDIQLSNAINSIQNLNEITNGTSTLPFEFPTSHPVLNISSEEILAPKLVGENSKNESVQILSIPEQHSPSDSNSVAEWITDTIETPIIGAGAADIETLLAINSIDQHEPIVYSPVFEAKLHDSVTEQLEQPEATKYISNWAESSETKKQSHVIQMSNPEIVSQFKQDPKSSDECSTQLKDLINAKKSIFDLNLEVASHTNLGLIKLSSKSVENYCKIANSLNEVSVTETNLVASGAEVVSQTNLTELQDYNTYTMTPSLIDLSGLEETFPKGTKLEFSPIEGEAAIHNKNPALNKMVIENSNSISPKRLAQEHAQQVQNPNKKAKLESSCYENKTIANSNPNSLQTNIMPESKQHITSEALLTQQIKDTSKIPYFTGEQSIPQYRNQQWENQENINYQNQYYHNQHNSTNTAYNNQQFTSSNNHYMYQNRNIQVQQSVAQMSICHPSKMQADVHLQRQFHQSGMPINHHQQLQHNYAQIHYQNQIQHHSSVLTQGNNPIHNNGHTSFNNQTQKPVYNSLQLTNPVHNSDQAIPYKQHQIRFQMYKQVLDASKNRILAIRLHHQRSLLQQIKQGLTPEQKENKANEFKQVEMKFQEELNSIHQNMFQLNEAEQVQHQKHNQQVKNQQNFVQQMGHQQAHLPQHQPTYHQMQPEQPPAYQKMQHRQPAAYQQMQPAAYQQTQHKQPAAYQQMPQQIFQQWQKQDVDHHQGQPQFERNFQHNYSFQQQAQVQSSFQHTAQSNNIEKQQQKASVFEHILTLKNQLMESPFQEFSSENQISNLKNKNIYPGPFMSATKFAPYQEETLDILNEIMDGQL